MPDNKIRISGDILTKAEQIAAEWGLKNARAAVEAVFRRYCDDYLYGRLGHGVTLPGGGAAPSPDPSVPLANTMTVSAHSSVQNSASGDSFAPPCEALDALDDLLAM
ncbi:MAG: hypothetical protein AAGF01_02665 [Cyanobacteria bacterium P01_G01_bin.38]